MSDESTLLIAIKNFAMEAERFKVADLAQLLKQPEKKILKLIKSLISEGELTGVLTTKNDEFVSAERLKTEITRVLKNPRLINQS